MPIPKRVSQWVRAVRNFSVKLLTAPLLMARSGWRYWKTFWDLGFTEKHAVVGTWSSSLLSICSVLLSAISIFITISIYREQKVLQEASNRIQDQNRREERNDRIKEEIIKANGAFEMNNVATTSRP